MSTFYLTTPIYYPNARPHVGSAYTTIVCDVLARYKRMCGHDVAFLTGTDEHGEKLQRAAAEAGKSPREFVAEKRQLFIDLWKKLGIDPVVYPYEEGIPPGAMRFVYTDHPDHFKSVRRMLLRARANKIDGQEIIYKKRYEGRYCIFDEMYVSEGSDPINCPNCGRPTELISEENYFFRLSAYKERLLDHYAKHPDFVRPDFRMNEVKNFVKDLRDISISRKRIKWGIPFPLDEGHDDPEQVFYVWFDALVAYMTGIGYAEGENGSETFRKYWRNRKGPRAKSQEPEERRDATEDIRGALPLASRPLADSELVHMVGKDILRFHAVYWPAFIMAAYPDQPEMLPTTVFAHGWIYYEQDKMSKSKGNVVYPEPIVEALDSFGAPGNDALRYYLLREAPFGQDTSFSYEALIQRYNSDLANDLGNLANRTLTMLHRSFEGRVPDVLERDSDAEVPAWQGPSPDRRDEDLKLTFFGQETPASFAKQLGPSSSPSYSEIALSAGLPPPAAPDYLGVIRSSRDALDRYDFSNALVHLLHGVHKLNLYLAEDKPWTLQSSDIRLAIVLYRAADLLATIALLVYPVLPEGAERLWKQLGCEGRIEAQKFSDLKWGGLKPGTRVGKPEPIFPRLDKAKALAKLEEYAEADRQRSQPKGATIAVPSEEQPALGSQPSSALQADSSSPPAPQNDSRPLAASEQSAMPSPEPRVPPTGRSPSAGAGPSPAGQSAVTPTTDNQQSSTTKITIDDFAKIEMVVGQIVSAEAIPKAQKLLKLQVDIGTEIRQVCAGIAEFYKPEEIVGQKIVLVANLEPRKLRGVESNGMVVAASIGSEGRPVLATFKEDVPNGTRLK